MDNHSNTTSEITFHHEHSDSTSRIWRTFWILLIVTIIELGLGLLIFVTDMPAWLSMFLKGVIVILTLVKAFYIVSIFMHLGDEIKNMIMTVVVPLMLFIWFIAAFLWDGYSYNVMRNTYDTHYKESTMEKAPAATDTTRRQLD